ncbi:MAG TPA: hypothetical protein VND99_01590 [Candidatus Acidoferrales bacterium]|nr:hypothetical protein [Candidatus Acidoferrales bacterium]
MDEKKDESQQDTSQTPTIAPDTQVPADTNKTDAAPAAQTPEPAVGESTATTESTPASPETPSEIATPPPTETPQTASPTTPVATTAVPTAGDKPATPKGKSKMLIIIIIIVLIIIVAAGAYLFLTRKASPQAMNTQNTTQKTSMVSPAKPTAEVTPVTAANVDQTLNNTDSTVQSAVDQANTDLNSVSQVDSSQDSTTGL